MTTRGWVLAGLVALALLAMGEAAPGAFPVRVVIDVRGDAIEVDVDGARHVVSGGTGDGWRGVQLDQPGPLEREYQIDGSDTTSNGDRQPLALLPLLGSPLYGLAAWLRDEGGYSRWANLRITDPATGRAVPLLPADPPGTYTFAPPAATPSDAQRPPIAPAVDDEEATRRNVRVEAELSRPEAAARLWLLGAESGVRQGLELDRDQRNARWLVQRGGIAEALPRWFFPEQPLPFAAMLVHLIGRAAAAAYGLALLALLVGTLSRRLLPAATSERPVQQQQQTVSSGGRLPAGGGWRLEDWPIPEAVLATWLLGAALLSAQVYQQLPHILDAASYSFQAAIFRGGRLWLPAPDLAFAFRGPFQVITDGRWFSQYPPGAAAAYALGGLAGLDWLVGPAACAALIGATAWTARALHGRATGLLVLALGCLSPFILFQAGSFLSHPIAAGLLACALAAYVAGERSRDSRWYGAAGALLGAAFVTREAASLLFAVPLVARLVALRRWTSLGWLAACGVPWLAAYLLYNAALTGSPLVLPRSLFDASDRFGFGDDIGFHRRHTLAAGLANTDELLTLTQFDLFGWPPLFALALIGVPFLFGRARAWDLVAGAGLLTFVVAYAGYFYHGIALGPRYYFEAVPYLLLLAGRGGQVLAHLAGTRLATALIVGALSLYAAGFYLPAELSRRADYSGLPDARPINLSFVRPTVFGPRLVDVPTPSLILTNDWWLYATQLAALNCPQVPRCPALFAVAPTPAEVARLRAAFPGRVALRAVERDGRVTLEPD